MFFKIIHHNAQQLMNLAGSTLQISDSKRQPRYMHWIEMQIICVRVYLEKHVVKKQIVSFSACS